MLNNEFDLLGCELLFWLHEHDIAQISCALAFCCLRWQTMFEYYVGGECQDRVDLDSNWYVELIDNHCSEGSSVDSDEKSFDVSDTDSD